MKISPFKKGEGHVVSREIKVAPLNGAIFSFRAYREGYAKTIPSALCIPFDSRQSAFCAYRLLRLSFERVQMRKAKRCRDASYEVKVLFSKVCEANTAYTLTAKALEPPF